MPTVRSRARLSEGGRTRRSPACQRPGTREGQRILERRKPRDVAAPALGERQDRSRQEQHELEADEDRQHAYHVHGVRAVVEEERRCRDAS